MKRPSNLLLAATLVFAVACKDTPPEPTPTARATPSASAAPAISSSPPAPPVPPGGRAFVAAMNDFCVITQQVNEDAKVKKSERPTEIVKRLLAKSPPPEFLGLLTGLGDLASGDRYAALRKAAADRGAPNWSCPALAE